MITKRLRWGTHLFSYGGFMLTVIVATGLWIATDGQAGATTPGWFTQLSKNVWCQTKIAGDNPEHYYSVWHYPHKRLKRVLEDTGIPEQYAKKWLAAERETECYASWREASYANLVFMAAAEGYEEIIEEWPEEKFEDAMKTLSFSKGGRQVLEAAFFREAEQGRSQSK